MQFIYNGFVISVITEHIDDHWYGTFSIGLNGVILRQENRLYVNGPETNGAGQTLTIAKAYVDRLIVGDLAEKYDLPYSFSNVARHKRL